MGIKAALLLVALVLLAASPAGAAPSKGVVVGQAGSLVLVAAPNGKVIAVRGHAPIGTRVVLSHGKLLRVGAAHHAAVTGVVVGRRGGTTFLATGRHVLAMRASAATAAGTMVRANVSIGDDGALHEAHEVELRNVAKIEIEGVVTALGAGTVTLMVGGQSLTIPLPAGVTVPASAVGGRFELELSFAGAAAVVDEDDDATPTPTPTTTTATTTPAAQDDDRDGHDRGDDGGHHGDSGGGDRGHGGGGR